MRRSWILIGAIVAAAVFLIIAVRSCRPEKPAEPPAAPTEPIEPEPAPPTLSEEKPVEAPKIEKPKKEPRKEAVLPPPELKPPPVQIHKELIPKDITIVRVYYAQSLTGPGSAIAFDINGSGFTKEFEKMIKVESGNTDVAVRDLALVTPNQIHGTLVISPKTKTGVSFPQVLINNKVVFQAPEPFAVIRPGEVLNLVFTEMGESGRSGRFRVFTNLTEEMAKNFSVEASTPTIFIRDLTPHLPFIVDGTIEIGPALGGEYDIDVKLKGKSIWLRKGIIRLVKPNVGQTGLVQRLQPVDGFHRPGDKGLFILQGSGFAPEDVGLLTAKVSGYENIPASFTYRAPGRMDLSISFPTAMPARKYGIIILQGDTTLVQMADIFSIVPANWTRGLRLEPDLKPGGESTLILAGRDLDKNFVESIRVEVDEPQLKVGAFMLKNPQEAHASISAGPDVLPGDYLIKMTTGGTPVTPHFGNVIRVTTP